MSFQDLISDYTNELARKVTKAQDEWMKAMLIVHGGIDYIGISEEEMAKKAINEGFRMERKSMFDPSNPLDNVYVIEIRKDSNLLGKLPITIRMNF